MVAKVAIGPTSPGVPGVPHEPLICSSKSDNDHDDLATRVITGPLCTNEAAMRRSGIVEPPVFIDGYLEAGLPK